MGDIVMQGGNTQDGLKEVLRVTEAAGHELNFVVMNQSPTKQLIYTIEEARGAADTPSTPDFSSFFTLVSEKILDPKKAQPFTLPQAVRNNYRIRVRSAVAGESANFRVYCEKTELATGTPLQAGAFAKWFDTAKPPYEAVGRGVAISGSNLQYITHVVVYDGRNPTADVGGVRVVVPVAPYAEDNIMNDGLGAYLDAPDGSRLMVRWPLGFVSPVVAIGLIDEGATADMPRELIQPVGGIVKPTPVVTSVTSPEPLSIRIEGENLGAASFLLTSRSGSPRNYDKGGWFGRFGAALPSETMVEIKYDWGADNLAPVDEAGIRDSVTGADIVSTGLSVDMDDPGTSSDATITNAYMADPQTVVVEGSNLDSVDVQRLTAGFTNGSITAYKPGGPLEPYNSGNGITIFQWDSSTIMFQSPYTPSGALLGVSVQNLSGSSLADYVV